MLICRNAEEVLGQRMVGNRWSTTITVDPDVESLNNSSVSVLTFCSLCLFILHIDH